MDPYTPSSPSMNKRLNVRLLVRLGAALVVTLVLLHGLHLLQAARHARHFRRQASEAEKQGDLAHSAIYLGRYLMLRPDDPEIAPKHGCTLARLATTPATRWHAYHTLDRTLRRDPHNVEVREALGYLAVELKRFDDALRFLEPLRGSSVDQGMLEDT